MQKTSDSHVDMKPHSALLDSYIMCSSYTTVLFCWHAKRDTLYTLRALAPGLSSELFSYMYMQAEVQNLGDFAPKAP